LPFFFASPVAMELLKVYFRHRTAKSTETGPQGSGSVVPVAGEVIASFAQQAANLAAAPQPLAGGNNMLRVLVPVDGSRNSQFAVKHIIKEFMNNTAMEIHLLNVQQPFNGDIARFVSRKSRLDYHREQADKALAPIKQMLDSLSIPYAAHMEIGHKAQAITANAHRLHCDLIVMSTSRKNSLTRLVEDSVTNRVLELTSVPVEVIAGDPMSRWERYGIPAGLGTLIALVFAAAD
jgi:nucleotide-binding universal stress UspA family protein